jgi:hypothetical protein
MSKTNEQSWQFRDGPCLKNERDVLRKPALEIPNRPTIPEQEQPALPEADRNRRHHCGRSGQGRLHLAPQDILFAFYEVEPNFPRFPAGSIRRDPTADA